MANVPQNVILIMAFQILEPPVLAAIAPSRAKNRMEKAYLNNIILSIFVYRATMMGIMPPNINAAPDAKAACNGLAWLISLIPNSSLA